MLPSQFSPLAPGGNRAVVLPLGVNASHAVRPDPVKLTGSAMLPYHIVTLQPRTSVVFPGFWLSLSLLLTGEPGSSNFLPERSLQALLQISRASITRQRKRRQNYIAHRCLWNSAVRDRAPPLRRDSPAGEQDLGSGVLCSRQGPDLLVNLDGFVVSRNGAGDQTPIMRWAYCAFLHLRCVTCRLVSGFGAPVRLHWRRWSGTCIAAFA